MNSKTSDKVWFAGLSIGLLFTLIAAFWFTYPTSMSGKWWAYAGLFIRGGLYLWAGDAISDRGGRTLVRLFHLGLVAGILELLVDWWLIHGVSSGRLVYLTGNDVVLLGSPIWMPLAWACVIVELGYPALRLESFVHPALATLVISVSSGVTVGFYEYFAYKAGWWKYEPAHTMLGPYCALFIPLGEALMFLTILPVAHWGLREDGRWRRSLEAGSLFAGAIAGGYGVAYLLLEAFR